MAEQNERTVRVPERFLKNKMVKIVGAEAYAVFSIIILHARWSGDNTGEAWPTYNTIHELTGFHRHTIAEAVKRLEGGGYIHVELKRRKRKDGTEFGRPRNHYKVSHLQTPGLKKD